MTVATLSALILLAGQTPPQPAVDVKEQFYADGYPAAAMARGEEGRVTVELRVGPNGRVTACAIVASSGSAALDEATCRIAHARLIFHPARDAAGRAIAGAVRFSTSWSMPE